MRRLFTLKLFFLISILLVNVHICRADWVQDGGIFNVDANHNAYSPDIAVDNNTPYVVWSEEDGVGKKQVYVKKYNGISWDHASGSVESLNVDPNESANYPGIAAYNNTPYVVWAEDEGNTRVVYVKYLNGTGWEQMGGSLNVDPDKFADFPAIALDANTPYITWREDNAIAYQIYCKHWNGSDWEQDGGSLNLDGNVVAYFPDISMINSLPHITWEEDFQIYVKKYNGSNWEMIGTGSLNILSSAYYSAISSYLNEPYVTWMENYFGDDSIYVKKFNGGIWNQIGSNLNIDINRNASVPAISNKNGTPYVVWTEDTFVVGQIFYIDHVYVKYFNGGEWVSTGSGLNIDANYDAYSPGIGIVNNTPYVAWSEKTSNANHVYIKYYIPPTPTVSPTITVTSTVSPTATISPTPTSTPTHSPTGTITVTATNTPTITPTATITSTATISQTETLTPTGTPTSSLGDVDLQGKSVLAYPNPARDKMSFLLHLAQAQSVKIVVYNLAGDRVAEISGELPAGRGQVLEWDCSGVAAGVYIARIMINGKQVEVTKVAVIK